MLINSTNSKAKHVRDQGDWSVLLACTVAFKTVEWLGTILWLILSLLFEASAYILRV